jgi:hypothetical protein
LLPHIEGWLNKTVASPTGYSPSELIFGERRPSIFDKVLPEIKPDNSDIEDLNNQIGKGVFKDKNESCGKRKKKKERKY